MLALIEKHESDETVRSVGFAIKFYLNTIKKDSAEIQKIPDDLLNVKKEKKLPVILSKRDRKVNIYNDKH